MSAALGMIETRGLTAAGRRGSGPLTATGSVRWGVSIGAGIAMGLCVLHREGGSR
ncbi:MAG: hypothetical protein HW381_1091 [Candidatus Rokubacteria bacterium]|nr:hypothetical protein [Candidatus Rokubacteria bacterium]